MLRREVVVVSFSVKGVPWQKRRMLYGSLVPSSALELLQVSICGIVVLDSNDLLSDHVKIDHASHVHRVVLICLR